MRNAQADIGLNEMNCDGGEKHINGEQAAGDDDELGSVNHASDNDASADGTDGAEAHGEPDEDDLDLENGEFSALNSALDELQGALDNLESRNDGIHQELLQLLQSNREIRTNMMEENGRSNNPGEPQDALAVSGAVASTSRGIRCLANDLLSDLPSIAKLDLGGPASIEPTEAPSPNPNPETSRESSQNVVLPDLIPSASPPGACARPN